MGQKGWYTCLILIMAGIAYSEGYDAADGKIINVATPTNDYDAATKKYVDDSVAAAGGGDITDVWTDLTGGVDALTAAAGDSLNAGSADSTIPWKVNNAAAPTTEGESIWDADDDWLTVGDGAATLYFIMSGHALTGDITATLDTDGSTATALSANSVSDNEVDYTNVTGADLTLSDCAGNIYTTADLKGDELTLTNPTQDWKFTGRSQHLGAQAQTSAQDASLDVFTADGDRTDNVELGIYAKGSPADVTNSERLAMFYSTVDGAFSLATSSSGTGSDLGLKILATGAILYLEAGATGVRSLTIVGDTTASAANMYIAASGQMYKSTSSSKYKTVDSDMTAEKAACVLNLRPRKFYSKCSGDDPNKPFYGFIADEVEAVFPEAANNEGYDINFIVAALIKHIQTQDERIKLLEKR